MLCNSSMDRSGMEIIPVDRLSELPEPIRKQILSLLSQKDAVRICILSKLWLHHWFTRPNVEFREGSFDGKKHTFESVVDNTLQRYYDQNLSIQEFHLQVSVHDSKSGELLRKWIPLLKICNIYFHRHGVWCKFELDIPSSVFEAESLQKLYLEDCTLDQKCVVNVLCKHLKTLHLLHVDIADETFKKIISRCPLIESVIFDNCRGLSVIKVDDKLHNLKHFEFTPSGCVPDCTPSIEIDVPSSVIEIIKIRSCPKFCYGNDQRNLKSLSLASVALSSKVFDFFSHNMPSLDFLEIDNCYGFNEFHLSSRSIRHLVFRFVRGLPMVEPIFGATIDAPNILSFKYTTYSLPFVFSFTTTNSGTHEWRSIVRLNSYDSLWFLKLYGLLKELSGSKISLELFDTPSRGQREITGDVVIDKKPVVVEHLELWLTERSMASSSDLLNELLSICHPRILVNTTPSDDFLSKFLVLDTGIKRDYLWQQDLEDVSKVTYNGFRLKWREI